MERIQKAIEKARDARQAQGEQAKTPGEKAERAHGTGRALIPTTWADLTKFTPNLKHFHDMRIVTPESDQQAASFDVIRTRLRQQMQANGWRRVAITSPSAACGKTTASVNLAFSMARQAKLKAMLIELDLRHPSMAKILGLQNQHQFSKVLSASAAFSEHAVVYDDNLAIATNHSPIERPAELLSGSDSARIIDGIEKLYKPDIMIFDMPPMLGNDDVMAFLDQIDCVLLIAAAEKTTYEEIEKCEATIASRSNFLGVVLNKCRYLDKAEREGS
ncbi:CpsD/CapB family tyrosine-protein kinase [Roseovarius sp. Pro17]|uniref:CpsD/CapB family tyrosine-protein kinase n=1 Tax=Roseovarius sp. Pro17 TaxID=3108175 RepID=UPI002D774978|nr:CpsD/CapB family tyrosine-protein kinase [Roseovarius sp. Pro17]